MECREVRDRFSSLLENDLDPLEEKIVREHLGSCLECQKDLKKFEKTIQWIHSLKEVEVPDGLLNEIYEKMEKPKRKLSFFPLSLKLPVQAAAMVAIVFSVLYLTKMMPVETQRVKYIDATKPLVSAPLPAEKQMEQALPQKELEKDRMSTQPPSASSSTAPPGPSPPQEIVLKISDREKSMNQLHELLQQFGGKIVTKEGDVFLASLPAATFSDFEKQLTGLSSSEEASKIMLKKEPKARKDVSGGAKGMEFEMKKEEVLDTESADRILLRIHLLQDKP